MARSAAGFVRDRQGAVALLSALCLVALMGSAAIAVDVGQVFLRSRQLQGVADLAALASVQALDPSATTTPAAAASATAALNSWPGGVVADASTGVYTADPSTPAAQRFTATAASPNAVKVTLHAQAPLYFAGLLTGYSSVKITRSAVAARAQYAAFSIGSRLASLNGGVANAVLSAMTGSQVSLSVMDYQQLASAQVDLLRYLPALQTRAHLQGMSYAQVLSASVAPATALQALADTLNASGQAAAAGTIQTLATAAAGLPATPLSTLLDLGPYAAQDHGSDSGGAALDVSALDMADATLGAASGSRQLSLSLNGLAPGIAQLSASLAIGQRPNHSPWLTVTDAGQVIVRTAQMRLYLQAGVAPGALAGATSGALVGLPVYVEAASAQAELKDISCPAAQASQAFNLLVSPSPGTLAIAQVDTSALGDFAAEPSLQTATVINAPMLKATAYGRIDLGGGNAGWQTVSFTQADVAAGTVKSVYAGDIAQASVASLLANTTFGVQTPAGGLGLAGAGVSPALQALLMGAAPSLDAVIAQVEAVSGARLGEADVRADGLRCRGAALMA